MTDSAEYSLIGSILLNPACLEEVRVIVKAEDFMIPQSRDIFRACCREVHAGREGELALLVRVIGCW